MTTNLVAILQSADDKPWASISFIPAKGSPYQVLNGIDRAESRRDLIGEGYSNALTEECLVQREACDE